MGEEPRVPLIAGGLWAVELGQPGWGFMFL